MPYAVLEAMNAGRTLVIAPPMLEDVAKTYDGEPALILGSSGSTGVPKLAIIPWSAVQARIDMAIAAFGPERLAHVGYAGSQRPTIGVLSPVLAAIQLGGQVSVMDLVHLGWGEAQGCTMVLSYNSRLDQVQGTVEGLTDVLCVGQTLTEAQRQAIATHTPGAQVRTWYGSTEAGSIALSEGSIVDDLVGQPFPQVDVRITDGIVEVKSPGLAVGYVGADMPLSDGWYSMGDRGWLDTTGLHVEPRLVSKRSR